MDQKPLCDESQQQLEHGPQKYYSGRPALFPPQSGGNLKTKLKFLGILALLALLLSLGVSALTFKGPSAPYRNAGVSLSATTSTSVYYVSPAGNDTNNGSSDHPFASIQKAASIASAGATIHVLPGTYTKAVNSVVSGTAQQRITFISDVKWGAKIVTHGVRTSWTNFGSYVDIQGFDITGDGDIGINDYGSYVRIIGNHVHHYAAQSCGVNGAAGIDDSVNGSNQGNAVIGNVVDHIGPLTTYCNLDQGIYHSTPGGYIANNVVYAIAAYGIHTWHSASSLTIANNLVFNCGQGGIIVANNQTLADNFLVVNNISVYNNTGIYEYAPLLGTHNRYLDNLVYGNRTNLLLQKSSTVQGTRTADPRFVNFQLDGSGDYHLSVGSPAIGAGISTGAPASDIDGTPRTSLVDIGPYVYQKGLTGGLRTILKKR